MKHESQTTFCPNCSCLNCRLATFNKRYENLRSLAKQYGNYSPNDPASIGLAISDMRQFPENIGRQAIDLLDEFHGLLWRKYDKA